MCILSGWHGSPHHLNHSVPEGMADCISWSRNFAHYYHQCGSTLSKSTGLSVLKLVDFPGGLVLQSGIFSIDRVLTKAIKWLMREWVNQTKQNETKATKPNQTEPNQINPVSSIFSDWGKALILRESIRTSCKASQTRFSVQLNVREYFSSNSFSRLRFVQLGR